MTKSKNKKTVLGLSLFQTITLLLILFIIILSLCGIYYNKTNQKSAASTAIVVTSEVDKSAYNVDDMDVIGDFILNHEYFAADEDVLDVDIENLNKTIDEIEKDITQKIKQEKIVSQENVKTATIEEKKHEILNKIDVQTPLIAIVVDDMGINKKRTLDIISINAPLTSSFLTYGNDLADMAQMAQSAGHEIMIHAPMEPKVNASLAPDTLKTDMDKNQIEISFVKMLDKFDSINVKGVNNHMGSKFTEDKERLGYVMKLLKNKNMFFLDSKTSAASKGKEIALENEINFAQRDVFLDNENNYDYILNQLKKTEKIAIKNGFAIAICHPKSQTYLALKDWVGDLKNKNVALVHVSKIVENVNKK